MVSHEFKRVHTGFYMRDDSAYSIRRFETSPQRFVWNVYVSDMVYVASFRTLKAAMVCFG